MRTSATDEDLPTFACARRATGRSARRALTSELRSCRRRNHSVPPSRANTSTILIATNTSSALGLRQLAGPLDQVGDPDAELAIDDHDFAAGDEPAVDQHVHRCVGGTVELQDGAGLEAQQVPERHAQPAD